MPESDVDGRFIWYELLTTDPDAAVDFYRGVLGWGTDVWEAGEEPYTMWTNGGSSIGGVMRLPDEAESDGAPPFWLPYVATADVDGTVEKARERGATVYVEPRDIPEVGRMAVLADPQGAVFALYARTGDHPGLADPEVPGNFSWHELACADWEDALAFYGELFGWEGTDATDMGEMGIYQMYGLDGATLGGMFSLPDVPPHWMLYVTVEDIDATVAEVEAGGGEILNGPMEVPGGGHVAQCRDPQGAAFALHQPA